MRVSFKLVLLTVAVAISSVPSASAQNESTAPVQIRATYAAPLSRYYAPYAIQAAAAYIPKNEIDATLGPSGQPALDGADVGRAVAYVTDGDATVAPLATKYLRAWQYQFGSEGYLTCFESDPECLAAIDRDRWTFRIGGGPAFQVWARTRYPAKNGAACSEVSIAFRGTTAAFADWIGNFDVVTGGVTDDHYRQLRRNVDAIIKKVTTLDCYRRARRPPQIVSVGHSLGGGLAQFAGLANHPRRPRIAKVFAFDPSPVTGAAYVDKRVLADNAGGLEIDRVYQSGEVLQRLRGWAQRLPRSPVLPCVRDVSFDLINSNNAIRLHSMAGLAGELVKVSARYQYEVPEPHRGCPGTRYRAPETDDDVGEPDQERGSGPIAARSQRLIASASPGGTWFNSGEAQYPGSEMPVAQLAGARVMNANARIAHVRRIAAGHSGRLREAHASR